MFSYVWLLDYSILLKAKYDELMSLVSPIFHTEVTVSIGFKVGTSIPQILIHESITLHNAYLNGNHELTTYKESNFFLPHQDLNHGHLLRNICWVRIGICYF